MARPFHVLMPIAGSLESSPFGPVIETLVWGLRQLGHDATHGFGDWRPGAIHIVLCPHLLDAATRRQLPPETILYNIDQITPSSPLPPSRLWDLRHWLIWDFSERNLPLWDSLGIRANCVPLGWYPGLARVPAREAQDIDVLFYGARNHRREAIIGRIAERGLSVTALDRVFGAQLDELIARAKVVLNVHYYPAKILETMRLSYLLGNGKAVLSERFPNTEVPKPYENAVRWSPYNDLVAASVELVADAEARAALAAAGRAAMERLLVTPILAAALEEHAQMQSACQPVAA